VTVRLAVTGGGGFIGVQFIKEASQHDVTPQVHVGPSGTSCAEELRHRDPFYGDICDRKMLRSLVDGADVVVHLAGPASVSASFDDPVACVTAHTAGTAAVLEACRDAKVQRIVYISSAEVYGNPPSSPVAEDAPLAARSPYGAAKIAAEELVRLYGAVHGLDFCILRLFSVYGPRQNDRSVLSAIIRQARQSGTIRLFDLTPTRDYVYVEDVATAIWASIAHARPLGAGRTFNVGTGVGTSVADLAQTVLSALSLETRVEQASFTDRPRHGSIGTLVADTSAIREALLWKPRFALAAGVAKTLEQWTDA
jgi:nucleoside-diphosphate-sugar epimerase